MSSVTGTDLTAATERGTAITEETETVIVKTATTAVERETETTAAATEKAAIAEIAIGVDAAAETDEEETDLQGERAVTEVETATDPVVADQETPRGNVPSSFFPAELL